MERVKCKVHAKVQSIKYWYWYAMHFPIICLIEGRTFWRSGTQNMAKWRREEGGGGG
jgi:hypothetical protein